MLLLELGLWWLGLRMVIKYLSAFWCRKAVFSGTVETMDCLRRGREDQTIIGICFVAPMDT